MPVIRAFDVFRTGFDGGHHDGVGIANAGGIGDFALTVEHKADAACLAQIATVLGEGGPHGRRGAVAVVGHRLDDDGNTIGAVAFIADFFVILALAADGFLDRAFDVVLGHGLTLGLFHRQTQTRVLVRIGFAHLRRDGDFFGELGKHLGAQFVLTALTVLDICPF